jgi:hypothetical protein
MMFIVRRFRSWAMMMGVAEGSGRPVLATLRLGITGRRMMMMAVFGLRMGPGALSDLDAETWPADSGAHVLHERREAFLLFVAQDG